MIFRRFPVAVLTLSAILSGFVLAETQASPTTPIQSTAADWRQIAPENLWVIETSKGRVLVELDPRIAPGHVTRIQELTRAGFYDGLKFHRVLTGFMAQTGDPLGTGAGGSDLPDIAGEFSFRRGTDAGFVAVPNAGSGLTGVVGSNPVVTQPDAQMFVTADFKVDATPLFCPGSAGMARSSGDDSANSQFFLMMEANPSLDGKYTVFGRVVDGLDVVEALKPGDPADNGTVTDPDTLTRVRLAADIAEAERPRVQVMQTASDNFQTYVEATRTEKGARFGVCDIQPPAEVIGG